MSWILVCEHSAKMIAAQDEIYVSGYKSLYAVVVIYNRLCADIRSIDVLCANQQMLSGIYIVDNSDLDQADGIARENRAFCRSHGLIYCAMDGNKGLSEAYNHIVRILPDYLGYLTILDDDTSLPKDFFHHMTGIINQNPATCVVPVVLDDQGILSPCISHAYFFSRLKSSALPDHTKLSAVNSGLTIRTDYLQQHPFDTRLFLDYIDHLFMTQLRLHHETVYYTDLALHQSFSLSVNDINKQLRRYVGSSRDYINYCRILGLNVVLAKFILLLRSLKLNVRFRTLSFFPCFGGKAVV